MHKKNNKDLKNKKSFVENIKVKSDSSLFLIRNSSIFLLFAILFLTIVHLNNNFIKKNVQDQDQEIEIAQLSSFVSDSHPALKNNKEIFIENYANDLEIKIKSVNSDSNIETLKQRIKNYNDYYTASPDIFEGHSTTYRSYMGAYNLYLTWQELKKGKNPHNMSEENIQRILELGNAYNNKKIKSPYTGNLVSMEEYRYANGPEDQYFIKAFQELFKSLGYQGAGALKSPSDKGAVGYVSIWDGNTGKWGSYQKIIITDVAAEHDWSSNIVNPAAGTGFLKSRLHSNARPDLSKNLPDNFVRRWFMDLPEDIFEHPDYVNLNKRGGQYVRWVSEKFYENYDVNFLPLGENFDIEEFKRNKIESYELLQNQEQEIRQIIESSPPQDNLPIQQELKNQKEELGNLPLDEDNESLPPSSEKDDIQEISIKSFEYEIDQGWNLINLAFKNIQTQNNGGSFGAEEFAKLLRAKDIDVYYLYNGENLFTMQADGTIYGNSFSIFPNSAFFVFNISDKKSIELEGQEILEPIQINFNKGWNLIGIYSRNSTYDSKTFLNTLFENGYKASIISTYKNGKYKSFLNINGFYGDLFEINNIDGYYVKIDELSSQSDKFTL